MKFELDEYHGNVSDGELIADLKRVALGLKKNLVSRAEYDNYRAVSVRLRFIIMKRDNFKCQHCGRSPATDPTIILHVDHKTAWANGGETVLENLETLCSKCNIGKGNKFSE
ncbi:MAG: HNH endonuclease [Elusimicrobia bacterium]|nr:HNH endonuclease [Elusimicrobiota bacterium]